MKVKFAKKTYFFCSLLLITLAFALLACAGEGKKDSLKQSSGMNSTDPPASPSAAPASDQPQFDANRAFSDVRNLVEIGPHPAGSVEQARAKEYITGELRSYGLRVTEDEFPADTPVGARKMVNITAELPGESNDVILISSHYDTKLYKVFRFVGANDSGSSTGTLMELARVLAARNFKPKLTYWFVFFDGEEAFCSGWEECGTPSAPDNTYGSRHYVSRLKDARELGRVRAMILLDMIGYADLRLARDSMGSAWLEDIIWRTARDTGYGKQFIPGQEGVGGDDHEPFLKAGVSSADIIQLGSYPYWHQPQDTLDKISPESLKAVGDVILASLPRIEQHILNNRPG